MSAPFPSRRLRPEGGLDLDEEELARFRAWLVGRGYAATTAQFWAARIRDAHAHGVDDPAAVDAAYPHHQQPTRAGLREALLRFDEFRKVTRCGGCS